jgi:hypothetical protein
VSLERSASRAASDAGVVIAQIFFGLWLLPLGYLAHKSGMFPKVLGALLVVGGACYLVGLLAVFLVPGYGERINVGPGGAELRVRDHSCRRGYPPCTRTITPTRSSDRTP